MNTLLLHAQPYSLWLTRQLDQKRLDLTWLNTHLFQALTHNDFVQFADFSTDDEETLAKNLRLLRRHVMAHIMIRDLNQLSDLAEVTQTITQLADFAIYCAVSFAYRYYEKMYGTPIGQYSQQAQFLNVVAMGKAGGYELNVSSDIDLIFIFGESGSTNGKRERSNQEFFSKVGQKVIRLLDDITEDGQVFRVDMRLRPDGDSGALVCSETALEQYLITQGREWERYAWCKARVITPYAHDITNIVRPFVFRKYLDFNAYHAMRDLHQQICQEIQKKGMTNNIKLGAGGIREIEFVAQIFQMIRGGQNRSLQLKGTQETLHQLNALSILPNDTVNTLLEAYVFLRNMEHRLQYWDDLQTQTLPDPPTQQALLAQSMGFDTWQNCLITLNRHRQNVNQIFNDVLSVPKNEDQHPLQNLWQDCEDETHVITQFDALGFTNSAYLTQQLVQLKRSSKYRQLSAQAQQRFDNILPRLIEAASQCPHNDATLLRLLDFLQAISRRSAYLVFLQQYPKALKQVAQLMSQSAWLAQYWQQHPILLDELLSAQLMQPINWQNAQQELAQQLTACGHDTEAKMDVLRHCQHAHIFRLAVQDLAQLWTVEALSDELSQLADMILAHTLTHAWQSLPKIPYNTPHFAIIAYGKLGGKELGYVSDLDLVYLFDDTYSDAIDIYTKLSRRLNTWLSSNTGAGVLYDVDLRLRPNGESGFLAHSLTAFEKYQKYNAWTWEHQALTRARFVAGDANLGSQFEAIRRTILTLPRDKTQLKQDIISMREKMFATHPPVEDNVKYARGGVVDVEFIVQYWILAHSAKTPALLENYGNIALLHIAAQHQLVPSHLAEHTAQAYRYYRTIQHNKRLRDLAKTPLNEELRTHYSHVKQLWQYVFDQNIN